LAGALFTLAAAGAAFLAAAGHLVDGGPGAPLGLVFWDAALFVAFLDVLGLALLLVGVARFVAAGHGSPPKLRLLFEQRRFARHVPMPRRSAAPAQNEKGPGGEDAGAESTMGREG